MKGIIIFKMRKIKFSVGCKLFLTLSPICLLLCLFLLLKDDFSIGSSSYTSSSTKQQSKENSSMNFYEFYKIIYELKSTFPVSFSLIEFYIPHNLRIKED